MAADYSNKTITGQVGKVYELRRTKTDLAHIDFSVASTKRIRNDNGEWENGDTVWNNIKVWGKEAEHVSESLRPGMRVVVLGHEVLKSAYTKEDGTEVPARPQVVADDVAVSLKYNSVESDYKPKGQTTSKPKTTNKPKPASKPEPKQELDDLDDFDFDDLEDDEPPF